jgi:hypothetical protein
LVRPPDVSSVAGAYLCGRETLAVMATSLQRHVRRLLCRVRPGKPRGRFAPRRASEAVSVSAEEAWRGCGGRGAFLPEDLRDEGEMRSALRAANPSPAPLPLPLPCRSWVLCSSLIADPHTHDARTRQQSSASRRCLLSFLFDSECRASARAAGGQAIRHAADTQSDGSFEEVPASVRT